MSSRGHHQLRRVLLSHRSGLDPSIWTVPTRFRHGFSLTSTCISEPCAVQQTRLAASRLLRAQAHASSHRHRPLGRSASYIRLPASHSRLMPSTSPAPNLAEIVMAAGCADWPIRGGLEFLALRATCNSSGCAILQLMGSQNRPVELQLWRTASVTPAAAVGGGFSAQAALPYTVRIRSSSYSSRFDRPTVL